MQERSILRGPRLMAVGGWSISFKRRVLDYKNFIKLLYFKALGYF